MIGAFARKLFGSSNERRIKNYLPRVAEINALEKELEGLSDEALRARSVDFKKQLGEGKTLVATLPVYLNALSGRCVHVVTVNDYLAKRDAEWMGQIYGFLGLSVGVIVHDLDDEQRQKASDCDVTYGTNNALGFDYLRDNMKYRMEDMVQRGHI